MFLRSTYAIDKILKSSDEKENQVVFDVCEKYVFLKIEQK